MIEIRLRPWQSACVEKAMNWLRSGKDRHFLVNAAPGSGKTLCASVIAKRLIEEGLVERVIVIAPRKAVVEQWAKEFKKVTGRDMLRITGADEELGEYGFDLCATWSAVSGLLDGFQSVCRAHGTLVICDEHHHAAVEAAWGNDVDGAFADAKFALILTGTPIRSDGKDSVWLEYGEGGIAEHPQEGGFTLTYGESVELGYCRPITFHRHEGKFSVVLEGGDGISVSGTEETSFSPKLKRIKGLQEALDYYKLACTPTYLANGDPDPESYQASMLKWCIAKLDDLRDRMPDAGGLVIAPNILVAEYMAKLLHQLEGEKPILVHNRIASSEERISAFRNSYRRWIVSVAMVSEGVDIQRLRILAYLPNAQTELSFRQAMGRVVRNCGPNDDSRAYVVMPTHRIFEEYAKRVEDEMPSRQGSSPERSDTKICPVCEAECPRDAKFCHECDSEFPVRPSRLKSCDECGALNPWNAKECQNCGDSFEQAYKISLTEALRVGAIIRGMELNEDEVREGEAMAKTVREGILGSGDDKLIRILRNLPEESFARLAQILEKNK